MRRIARSLGPSEVPLPEPGMGAGAAHRFSGPSLTNTGMDPSVKNRPSATHPRRVLILRLDAATGEASCLRGEPSASVCVLRRLTQYRSRGATTSSLTCGPSRASPGPFGSRLLATSRTQFLTASSTSLRAWTKRPGLWGSIASTRDAGPAGTACQRARNSISRQPDGSSTTGSTLRPWYCARSLIRGSSTCSMNSELMNCWLIISSATSARSISDSMRRLHSSPPWMASSHQTSTPSRLRDSCSQGTKEQFPPGANHSLSFLL